MSRPDVDGAIHVAAAERREVQRDLRQAMLSGLALTVPLFVTLLVLGWVLNFVSSLLTPFADLIAALAPVEGMADVVVEALAAAILVGVVLAVGLAAQHGPDTDLGRRLDALVEDVPGVGSIYTSVERMSDVLLEGDADSFREVKLVEFPREDSYAIAFLTADAAGVVEDAAGRELVTVFVPMAPNPVMGGHLLSLPPDQVHDVDLSVEEGMEAVMTTGMTIDEHAVDEPA